MVKGQSLVKRITEQEAKRMRMYVYLQRILVLCTISTLGLAFNLGNCKANETKAGILENRSLIIAPLIGTHYFSLPGTARFCLEEMINELGEGYTQGLGFSVAVQYMYYTDDASNDWNYNPDLDPVIPESFRLAEETGLPVFFHLNGGPWSGKGGLYWHLFEDINNRQWNQDNVPSSDKRPATLYMCISRYNSEYQEYKWRNLQQVLGLISAWAAAHPDLFLGVSTDSEVSMDPRNLYADYNPKTLQEWRDYLFGEGIYSPSGRYAGEARCPTFANIAEFNAYFGTHFDSVEEIDPPRNPPDGSLLWQEWQSFRVLLVQHHVQDMVNVIAACGIPPEKIFTHQAVTQDFFGWASPLKTALCRGASLGVTLFVNDTVDESLYQRFIETGSPWAAVEFNPLAYRDYERNLRALQLAKKYGAIVICPFWYFGEGGHLIHGTDFARAIRDFVKEEIRRAKNPSY